MKPTDPAMPDTQPCPRCGTPIPFGALMGLCPACLLKAGVAESVADPKQPGFEPPSIEELSPLFPGLELLGLIGKGGMGAVYKARQRELDRIVALKILPPGIGDAPGFAERFTREARALAKLNHPGIVTIHDFGKVDGLYFFLMEYVDGVNLRQLQQERPISPREALEIVPQICAALQFAHDRGIVHRDIKPENILLDKEGRVKIADFGVAKIVKGETGETMTAAMAQPEDLTGAGRVLGTPNYMAPEQATPPFEVDHRADIYSLGVVFYQMLTGELPARRIEPPSQKVEVDVRLDAVVLRALERNRELRFQQVSEVKTRVETIAGTPPEGTGSRAPLESFAVYCAFLSALIPTLFYWLAPWAAPWLSPSGQSLMLWLTLVFAVLAVGLGIWTRQSLRGRRALLTGGISLTIWILFFVAGLVSKARPRIEAPQSKLKTDGASPASAGSPGSLDQEGWQLWQSGRLPQAISKFKEALKIDPDDSNAWNGLGWASFNSGKTAEAEEAFKKVIALVPQHPAALNGLGQIYLSQRKYQQAEAWLRKAADQGASAAWYGLARLYLIRGDFAEAEKWAQKVVDSGQGDQYAQKMLEAAKERKLPESLRKMIEPAAVPSQTGADRQSVQKAIDAWLALMDAGNYAESWRGASVSFQKAFSEAAWINESEKVRRPLGKIVSRKLRRMKNLEPLPGGSGGPCLVADYESTFAAVNGTARESVTFTREPDGSWKPAGYLITFEEAAKPEGEPRQKNPAEEQAALKQIENWLALMDEGNFSESWQKASAYFQKAVPEPKWVAESAKVRKPLGKLISRKMISSQESDSLPGAPDGPYIVAEYETTFAGVKGNARETVTFQREVDGNWKASGYFIKLRAPGDEVALKAAFDWLGKIDVGRYSESWDDASDVFRGAISKENWGQALNSVRAPLGTLRSRKLDNSQAAQDLPGAPKGEYLIFQFKTAFESKAAAVETVTFYQQKDGQWKAAGYFIK